MMKNNYNPPVIEDYTLSVQPLPVTVNLPHQGVNFGMIDTSYTPDNVIIVASGMSLKHFNLHSLRGLGYIITMNHTGKCVPFADAWITIDPWGLNGPQLPPATFEGKIYAGVSEDYNTKTCKITREYKSIDSRVIFLRRLFRTNHPSQTRAHSFYYRLSEDPCCVATGNSAYAALNLAYLLNPKKILLLGVDGGNGYFFTNQETNESLAGLNALFTSSLRQLESKGITVINGSLNSEVTCFPRYTIDAALSKL